MNKKKVISTVIAAVLIAVLAIIGFSASSAVLPTRIGDNVMRAVFFDVGYSDCALFYTKDTSILIGSPDGKCDGIIGYMKRAGIKTLDYFIIPDYAYENCIDAKMITDNFAIANVLMPLPYDGGKTNYYTIQVNNKGSNVVDIYEGMKFEKNGVLIEALSPTSYPSSAKDGGAVVRISYNGRSVLWCADINTKQEENIMDLCPEKLLCDIIKIPSHGSKSSSCDEFIALSGAEYAVISCGKNGYGHPSEEVLQRLKDAGVKTSVTQSNGAVVFDITGEKIEKIR